MNGLKSVLPILLTALCLGVAIPALAQEVAAPEAPLALKLIMRWMHVLSAIVLLGGSFFTRFVLMPSAKQALADDAHQQLRAAVARRWQRFVHVLIVLFLVSGLYNYLAVTRFEHEDGRYHMLFGIKFLLALVIFALALMLTSTKNYAAPLRAKAPQWLLLTVALGFVVAMMGGVMRALG